MTSSHDKLQATLQDLERELAALDTLDAPARQLLERAAADIRAKLGVAAPAAEPALLDQVHTAAREFEATHPELAAVLKRIAEGLAQLGI
ncbi:MAG: DUF4404 family protein [Pirellulales bacterium]